jgi:hypothetical protein
MTRKIQMPTGRLSELHSHPDAERMAYTLSGIIGENAAVTTFKSRDAMRQFCKDGSKMHALIKDRVHPTMLTNRNMQKGI